MLSAKRHQQTILRLLQEGDKHGLEIVEESQGFLARGSVYVHLSELQSFGYVTSYKAQNRNGFLRNKYAITPIGITHLNLTTSLNTQKKRKQRDTLCAIFIASLIFFCFVLFVFRFEVS